MDGGKDKKECFGVFVPRAPNETQTRKEDPFLSPWRLGAALYLILREGRVITRSFRDLIAPWRLRPRPLNAKWRE